MYAIVNVPGKGQGLVATKDICKGTRILEETPVITLPEYIKGERKLKNHIAKQVKAMSDEQRRSFLSMHNIYPSQNAENNALGIIRTVGLPIEADGIAWGVFLEAGRINHACDNNAQKHWNPLIGMHTVQALQDISNGEEITICYLGHDSSREIRQKKLMQKFKFHCACQLCSLPEDQSVAHDERIARIDLLDSLIGRDVMRMDISLRTLRYADERIRLMTKHRSSDAGISRSYFDAAKIALVNGDLARGRLFAERAIEGWRISQGRDSKEVIEHDSIVQHPSSFKMYGMSIIWKTAVDEIPKGLTEDEFDDWLWRRNISRPQRHSGSLANLRNRVVFPAGNVLPNNGAINLNYSTATSHTSLSERQYCFLGEIVESVMLHHLELVLTDLDGTNISLHFYTKGLGHEMDEKAIQRSYTVAVLQARIHNFKCDEPGLRHEDPNMLRVGPQTLISDFDVSTNPEKIFPISLNSLLDLSDQVQSYMVGLDRSKTCHGCNKKNDTARKCGRCSFFLVL